MKRFTLRFYLVFFCLLTSTVFAQEQTQIDVEWIYSDAGGELTTVPQIVWLQDNTAVILDTRLPQAEQSFIRLNPSNGDRSAFLDVEAALSSLNALLSSDQAVKSLSWPAAFDDSGSQAIYLFEGDVFVLNVEDAAFLRVTETDAAETSVSFSPDATQLAFVRENNLYVYNLSNRTERAVTNDGTETILNGTLSWVYWEEIFGRRDIGYWWSPNSDAIAYLQTDESEVDISYFLDFEPAQPRLIQQRYPKAGTKNPVVRAGVAHLVSGETTWIDLPEFEYLARVNWLPKGNEIGIQTMNRAQTDLALSIANPVSGNVRHVFTEKDPVWVNINDDLYFLDNGRHFIWQSERNGYAHLYRFTMDGTVVNQITKGDWAIRPSGGVFWLRQAVAAIDESFQWVYYTSMEKSSVERHLYRSRFDGTGMERLTHDDGTHAILFSPNGKYYFDTFSNTTTPPRLTLHTSDGKMIEEIAPALTDLLAGIDFQVPEMFSIPTSDGFPMPAEILKPADFDHEKPYPIIFNVYGGPSAPTVFNSWNTARYFDQILLSMGYLVVRFDHRASTAISKTLENRLDRMMSGPVEMKDIVDGVQWLKAQPWVDAERFGIWGWSGGGSFTLNAMTNTQEFKAGISVAPVSDWKYYDTKWAEFAMKTPGENPEGYEATSFVRSARNLHGTLLLVHGTYDDNVHPQNSWAFIDELVKHNIQFEMMFYPMRKHGIADRPARIHLFTKMLDFWSKNL